MNYIQFVEKEQANTEIQSIFENVEGKYGKVLNLMKALANSPVSLKAFTQMDEMLENGSFTPAEVQAALLAVSQVNQCDYCLAAHTAGAQKLGYSEAETIDMRKGEINDPLLGPLTRLAREITLNRGRIEPQYAQEFFDAGYSREQFTELFTIVSLKTLSNFFHSATEFPVDMPEAQKVPENIYTES